MPKRKRRDKQPTSRPSVAAAGPAATDPTADLPPVPVEIDPAVALFAQRHQEQLDRQKAEQRARSAERAKGDEHARLLAAKDEAVSAMKRMQRASSATADQRAAAETAYRSATADLIAHETGERPSWAPGPVVADDEPSGADDEEGRDDDQPAEDGPVDEPAEDAAVEAD